MLQPEQEIRGAGMKPKRTLFIVHLRPLPDDRDPIIRLRWLLKIAWRTFRFKCEWHVEREEAVVNE